MVSGELGREPTGAGPAVAGPGSAGRRRERGCRVPSHGAGRGRGSAPCPAPAQGTVV